VTALLLTFLALPGNGCSGHEARQVVSAAVSAGRRYDVPPALLLAVVMGETRCDNLVSKPTRDGGIDVGYAQIHVVDPMSAEVGRYLNPRYNLARAAAILANSRRTCTGRGKDWRGCKVTVWALYNYRSETWWPKVRRYLEAMRGHAEI